jgi:hypothetical protein
MQIGIKLILLDNSFCTSEIIYVNYTLLYCRILLLWIYGALEFKTRPVFQFGFQEKNYKDARASNLRQVSIFKRKNM